MIFFPGGRGPSSDAGVPIESDVDVCAVLSSYLRDYTYIHAVLERKQFLDAPPNKCCCATRLVTVQTAHQHVLPTCLMCRVDAFPHSIWGDARARRPQLLWPPASTHAPIPPHPTPFTRREAALSVKHATQFPSIISAFLGGRSRVCIRPIPLPSGSRSRRSLRTQHADSRRKPPPHWPLQGYSLEAACMNWQREVCVCDASCWFRGVALEIRPFASG